MPTLANGVVGLLSALTVGLGWFYFRRFKVNRPPIGVFNRTDVLFVLGAILAMPFIYLGLPDWLAAAIFGLVALSLIYTTLEPVLPGRVRWTLVLGLAGLDIAACWGLGSGGEGYLAVNNLVIIIGVVGIANLWAQSGMQARDAALLGLGLIVYDFLATAQSGLMFDLLHRLSQTPFAPVVAWGGVSIGLGDLIMATVFPLVLRKAYGRKAGLIALALAVAGIAAMLSLPLGLIFPAMLVLGPLMVVQYLVWQFVVSGNRPERTTRQYLQAEL